MKLLIALCLTNSDFWNDLSLFVPRTCPWYSHPSKQATPAVNLLAVVLGANVDSVQQKEVVSTASSSLAGFIVALWLHECPFFRLQSSSL
jgi:hypothetical protein